MAGREPPRRYDMDALRAFAAAIGFDPEKVQSNEYGDRFIAGPKGRVYSVCVGRMCFPDGLIVAPDDGFLISINKKIRADFSFCAEIRRGVSYLARLPMLGEALIIAAAIDPPPATNRGRGRPRKTTIGPAIAENPAPDLALVVLARATASRPS
jgi:hypothetical protein